MAGSGGSTEFRGGMGPGHMSPHAMSGKTMSAGPYIRMGHNEKPNPKAPLGQGGRFAAVKASIAKRGGVRNPGAVAAAIGRKKYGAKKFAKLAAAGRKAG